MLYILTRLLITKTAKDPEAANALLNRMLGSALEDIAKVEEAGKSQPVDEAVITALTADSRYWPTNTEVRNGTKANPFYASVRSTSQKTFVLREIVYAQTDEKPDLSTLQIEHVMPDTLSAEWRKYLSDSPEAAIELHERLRHTIGNLTLIGHKANPAMRNVSWSAKRPFYRKSNAHNQDLAKNNAEWRDDQINARAAVVAETIIAAWPGPTGAGPVEPETPAPDLIREAEAPAHHAGALPPIREWAAERGLDVAARGPVPAVVRDAYAAAQAELT